MSLSLCTAAAAARDRTGVPLATVEGGRRGGHVLMWHEEAEEGPALVDLEPGERFALAPETRPGMRSVYHIGGPSGAGKSTVAAGFARNFQDTWPSSHIVVVSSVEDDDPAFEGIEHTRVRACHELDDVSMPELAATSDGGPTLIIFDDVEGLPKADKAALENFQQRALETGRKLGIHTLSLFHRFANGRSTKSSLGEANGLVWFPKANTSNLDYVLKHYFSVNPIVKCLLKKDWGRWVLARVDGCPSYLLGETRAALYDGDEIEAALKKEAALDKARAAAEFKASIAADKEDLVSRLCERAPYL